MNHEAIDFSQAKTTEKYGRQMFTVPIEAVKNHHLKWAILTIAFECASDAKMLLADSVARAHGFELAGVPPTGGNFQAFAHPVGKPEADFLVTVTRDEFLYAFEGWRNTFVSDFDDAYALNTRSMSEFHVRQFELFCSIGRGHGAN